LEAAENCARKAAAATDFKIKQNYLNLERSWLSLAWSFRIGERLTDFNKEVERRSPGPGRK
jgi:hypothetical protein